MAHPLEAIIREAYGAFGRGDLEGYLRPSTEDFIFNVPGRGASGLYELARRAIETTGGTFHEEVEDVLANDHHAVILARHSFIRDGQSRDYRTAHVYVIRVPSDGIVTILGSYSQYNENTWGYPRIASARGSGL